MSDTQEFPIKTRIVNVTNKKTGVKYREERQYRYDPVKGYNVVISSRRIGQKILKGETEPVRCRPKLSAAEKAEVAKTGGTRHFSATDLVTLAGKASGLEDCVRRAYPSEGTADQLLSLAQYLVIADKPIENIAIWQCNHDLPYGDGMSEALCQKLFDRLGTDNTGRQTLFSTLTALDGNEEPKPGIAFHSTSHAGSAETFNALLRQGLNKAGDGLEQYQLTTVVSAKTGLPVSFDMQAGNITDAALTIKAFNRLKSYGGKTPELVTDSSFFSKANVLHFLSRDLKFTTQATLDDKWPYAIFDLPDQEGRRVRDALLSSTNQCPFDPDLCAVTATRLTKFALKREAAQGENDGGENEIRQYRLYYHYYRSKARAATLKAALESRLKGITKALTEKTGLTEIEKKLLQQFFVQQKSADGTVTIRLNNEAFNAAQKDFGIFVLISNEHRNPWEALRLHRQRHEIEQAYRMAGRQTESLTHDRTLGLEICRHVALGLKFVLDNALNWVRNEAARRSEDDYRYMADERAQYAEVARWTKAASLEQILMWLDCIDDVNITHRSAEQRRLPESIERDRMFLALMKEKLQQQ